MRSSNKVIKDRDNEEEYQVYRHPTKMIFYIYKTPSISSFGYFHKKEFGTYKQAAKHIKENL